MLFAMVLASAVAFGALACPLWVASRTQADMPCSEAGGAHEQCPIVICLASSSYVAAESGAAVPITRLLGELPNGLATRTPPLVAQASQRDRESPPGDGPPLFLRIHSLLI